MYQKFFGFTEKPFDLTPDPKFLYLSRVHVEALASLTYGIHERRGFIVLVGEVGTGKTLLLNAALDRLDENTRVASIFNTDLTFNQMLRMALAELGLARPEETLTKVQALHRLNDFAIKQLPWGGNVALIVDEAQNLNLRSMENLRLLSNLETHNHKLVQIVLSGQPELDVKLSQPELRQLAQRISLKRYILPLSEEETYEFIQHRLDVVNYKGPSLFTKRTKQLIWEYSGGVPRKINILCDNACLIGYALKKRKIDKSVVEEAIKDLSWSPYSKTIEAQATTPMDMHPPQVEKRASPPWFALAAILVLVACLIFAIGLFLRNPKLSLQRLRSMMYQNTAPAKNTIQPGASTQSGKEWGTPLPSVPENEVKSGINSITEGLGGGLKPGEEAKDYTHEGPALNPWDVPDQSGEGLSSQVHVVVAARGDCLVAIINRAYGKCNDAILSNVLRKNPEITSPDQIFEGQVIRLPQID